MALLDVSFLMYDPDFADTVTGFHRVATVNSDGIGMSSMTPITLVGSIQHIGGNAISGQLLRQFADTANIESGIVVWTTYKLTVQSTTTLGDIIMWSGVAYLVVNIVPWLNWGAGWSMAICTLHDLVIKAPR